MFSDCECIVNVTTEFHYCPEVSRNYGGKTREIIIISDRDENHARPGAQDGDVPDDQQHQTVHHGRAAGTPLRFFRPGACLLLLF